MNRIKEKFKQLLLPTIYEASLVANKHLLYDTVAHDMRRLCLMSHDVGITDQMNTKEEIVVSLTTYGKRLYDVYLTIESIMQGTMKPNNIVLWLEDNLKTEVIPLYLQRQVQRGLEIRFCKDIKSYKKLIPSLKAFPDSIIVTIDDDVIYEPDVLEKLVNAYNKDSHHVYANRVNKITIDATGEPQKYSSWKVVKEMGESPLNFFTGVGGVLYPPHCFPNEVFNEDSFMNLAPYGDDIWFYAMALLNGYTVSKVFTHDENGNDFLVNGSVQDVSLYHINTEGVNMNDKQIKAVFERYNICKLLKS